MTEVTEWSCWKTRVRLEVAGHRSSVSVHELLSHFSFMSQSPKQWQTYTRQKLLLPQISWCLSLACKTIWCSVSFYLVALQAPFFAESMMAQRLILDPDGGREEGHKPKVHTSLLLTSPWPQLCHIATLICRRCWEVGVLFRTLMCPTANQRFCCQREKQYWETNNKQFLSKLENNDGENKVENQQASSSTGVLVLKTLKYLYMHW